MTREREALGLHVPDCSAISYATNPPSSGQHYSSWAPFRVFDEPIGRGFWVHSIEHGAVVILYSCRDCDEEIQAAKVMIEALPEDPVCVGMRRIILVPDPLLDVPWAAAAWGYTLRSECFEPEVFRDFALRFAGHGPEKEVCTEGSARP